MVVHLLYIIPSFYKVRPARGNEAQHGFALIFATDQQSYLDELD